MRVSCYDLGVSRDDLVREALHAISNWDWRSGAYGHALSLPSYRDLHPYRRYSYQNFPCTGLLATCPHLREVFDLLRCDKISFRLLRREARSAYAWHTDRWKGPGVVRFQIPLVSDESAFLVTTDYRDVDDIRGDRSPLSEASFARFAEANAGHFSRHTLEPGVLHYFNTTRVHTLVNGGAADRITLSFDLVVNDWLRDRFPAIADEAGSSPRETVPRPGGPARAWAWTCARFFPVRARARTWRVGASHGAE